MLLQPPEVQRDFAPFYSAAKNPEQLIHAADLPALAFQDHVALLEPGFGGGAAGWDLYQDHAGLAGQAVGGDFSRTPAWGTNLQRYFSTWTQEGSGLYSDSLLAENTDSKNSWILKNDSPRAMVHNSVTDQEIVWHGDKAREKCPQTLPAFRVRLNLFTYRELLEWLHDPSGTPPLEPEAGGPGLLSLDFGQATS